MHWHRVDVGLKHLRGVGAIAFDPLDPAAVFLATGAGILSSRDGGQTWTPRNTGLPDTRATALTTDPTDPGVIYASVGAAGVYRSMNGGETWSAAATGLHATVVVGGALAVDPSQPKLIFAGTGGVLPPSGLTSLPGEGVWKSEDGGSTWTAANGRTEDLAIGALAIDPLDPDTVWAGAVGLGGAAGLFVTTDGGASWRQIQAFGRRFASWIAIDPTDSDTLYVADQRRLLKTTDGGQTWAKLDQAVDSPVLIDPSYPATIYAGGGHGLFKSADGGATWTETDQGIECSVVWPLVIDPANPGVLYASSLCDGGLYRTTDGGDNWTLLRQGWIVSALAIDPMDPQVLYVGGVGLGGLRGVQRSTDGGKTWNLFSAGLTNHRVEDIVIDPSGTTLHVGTAGGGVFDRSLGE